MLWLSWLIVGIISNLFYCKMYSEILMNKKFKLNYKMFFWYLFFAIINCYSIYYNQYLRSLFINLCYVLLIYLIYRHSLVKSIIFAVLTLIINIISELIFSIVCTIFFKEYILFFAENFFGIIVVNLIIVLMSYYFVTRKFINVIIVKITKWYVEKNILNLLLIVLLFVITVVLLLYQIIYNKLSYDNLFVYSIFIVSLIVFLVNLFKENSEKSYISAEYDNLVDYVKKYENMLDQKSKEQHEHRNQLIIIRDKINKTNKKAIEYIDNILNLQTENNSEWLRKIKAIPSGGLKGLYYYKIEEMISNNINLYINVSDKLTDKSVWQCCEKNMYDITLIIGVYIDNAIHAAKESNEKYIVLDIDYEDEAIIFSFSNTFSGNIELNKLDDIKYTTKGTGHGYGLVIVKETLEKNNSLEQYREINGKYYVQKLIVKNKEKSRN